MALEARARASASAFTIQEMTGSKRTVRLTARALPYRPITFGGEMRADFTWYPGIPSATAQMLGAKETELSIKGWWKDKFLADKNLVVAGSVETPLLGLDLAAAAAELSSVFGDVGPPTPSRAILEAMELALLFDDIRQRGQLIQVTWDVIAREGFLTKFLFTPHNRADVEWEAVFTWTGQVVKKGPSVFSVELDVRNVGASWADQLSSLQDAIANNPISQFAGEVGDAIQAGANAIKQGVNAIQDGVDSAVNAVLSPIAATRSLLGSVQSLKQTTNNIIDIVSKFPTSTIAGVALGGPFGLGIAAAAAAFGSSSTTSQTSNNSLFGVTGAISNPAIGASATPSQASPSAAGSTLPVGTPQPSGVSPVTANTNVNSIRSGVTPLNVTSAQAVSQVTVGRRLQAAVFARGVLTVARQMRSLAARQESELVKRVAPDLLASFAARQDMDLREVSQRFYNTQEEWKRLLIYNQLDTSRLSAGQVVLVPKLRTVGNLGPGGA